MNIINKIKQNINNKKNIFLYNLNKLFKKKIDNTYFNSLTNLLIKADIGEPLTEKIITLLKKKNIKTKDELQRNLVYELYNIINPYEKQLKINNIKPFVILVVGVNGVGKTTTVGKLANLYTKQNKKVLVVAGDTYRAAGIEQIDYICKKHNINIIKQHQGADSASVIFDAFKLAKSKNFDMLIADTSGRLHTNNKLMSELKKIKNTLQKLDKKIPHEIIMIIDATFGQNSINQIKIFNKYLNITGIIISKLDGTAKAGTIFTIATTFKIPIRYIGNGENINNIKIFDSKKYINKLLETNI